MSDNDAQDRERLKELREKMRAWQSTDEDVTELMYLNWRVESTFDERDNYYRYLKPPERPPPK
jgi:hypothetical protein